MIAVDPQLDRRLSLRPLWDGAGVELVATAWSRARHPERSEGRTTYAAVEIMRAGAFEKRGARGRVLADTLSVVFYDPGEVFEVRHPAGPANAGLTIRLSPEALEARAEAAGRCAGPFRVPSAPSPPSLLLAAHRLVAQLSSDAAPEPLSRDETVLELVEGALSLGSRNDRKDAPTEAASRRARRVQAFLNESYSEPLRLADVARAAGCSVWHVAKQFKQATGSSIHAALVRLRLRNALEALRQGEDLSRLALAAGFSSHSHFTAAFHAEFGVAPRAAREALGPRGAQAPARSTIQ